MNVLKKLGRGYDELEEKLLVFSLLFALGLVFVQIIMRYIFNNSLSWSEELARYIFIWQIWLGVSFAQRSGSHIKISLLTDRLPTGGQNFCLLLSTTIWLAFCLFLVKYGFELCGIMSSRHTLSPALRLPLYLVYLTLPVSQLALSVRLVIRLVTDSKRIFGGGGSSAAAEEITPKGGDQ